MRLFKKSAFLVGLITQTFQGLYIFLGLFSMCVVAFANFFYIMNNNSMYNKYNTRDKYDEKDLPWDDSTNEY